MKDTIVHISTNAAETELLHLVNPT